MNLFILGDSIAYGAWDSEGGWVARLRRNIDVKSHEHLVYNLGVSGNTTEDLLLRFETEMQARHPEEESAVIFAIGTNDDVVWLHKENKFWVEPEKYEENLKKLYASAMRRTSRIAFVSLLPVDETKTAPTSWDTNASYTEKNILRYQAILTKVCAELGVPLIDVYVPLANEGVDKVLADGLHPNDRGHQLISEQVSAFLSEKKWI